LKQQIGSPLDRDDFWKYGSAHLILQVVWLDHEKISGERDKCFIFSVLYFRISSSCLYCINSGSVLIWLFVAHFSVLVGGSLVSLLIIVELFFLDDPWFLPLHWRIFHVKQIVSLFSLISILCFILYWCSSQVLASLGKLIFIANYSVIEFLIMLSYFPINKYFQMTTQVQNIENQTTCTFNPKLVCTRAYARVTWLVQLQ